MYLGSSSLVLLPETAGKVSEILKYCNRNKLQLVVQSGRTSLVGGSVPFKDEIVLSVERMNKIDNFDDTSGILTCGSGCILQNLEEFVSEKNHEIPYDLGAKGSCFIGGNVSTNAGGIRFLRYGSLRGTVLGLEVVLADGTILDLMSSMRKDTTGYDLKQLFIGSEGSLGVVTKVNILCPSKPCHKAVIVLCVKSFDDVLSVYKLIRGSCNEYLSAFELFDQSSLDAVLTNIKLPPLLGDHPFNILVELSCNDEENMVKRIDRFLDELSNKKLILNGTFTSDQTTMSKLWAYRERIAEALLKDGYCYKYDLSLPLSHFYKLVEVFRDRLSGNSSVTRVCGYGHVADFNLHLNITSKSFDPEIKSHIEPFVYEWISNVKGSISSEHGLGMMKRNYIHYSKSPEAISIMKQLKRLFDPNYILNPNKVLPD